MAQPTPDPYPDAPPSRRRHTRQPGATHPSQLTKTLIKAAFAAGSRATPGLAARTAAKLWHRLPRNAARRKDNRPSPGVIDRVAVNGAGQIVVESWGPPTAPLVYLVHGWGGWRGQVASFVSPLVDAGLRVTSFDALSHGDSDPGEHGPGYSSGGEMIRSLKALAAVYGPARGVIGHSLGCATAIRSMLEQSLQAERIALVAPNPDMAVAAAGFGRSLGISARTNRLMVQAMERWAHRTLADFDLPAMGATGQLPPALVVHDRDDTESPFADGATIVDAWPGSRLLATTGYGHHRILIAPEVIRAVTEAVT